MHVTHRSGGNRQFDVNINNGGGYLEIFELEVKLRIITVNKTSNLIVLVLSYFIINKVHNTKHFLNIMHISRANAPVLWILNCIL